MVRDSLWLEYKQPTGSRDLQGLFMALVHYKRTSHYLTLPGGGLEFYWPNFLPGLILGYFTTLQLVFFFLIIYRQGDVVQGSGSKYARIIKVTVKKIKLI